MKRIVARDWRLAALGGGCFALGSACLLLSACSGNLPRPNPLSAPAIAAPESVSATATKPEAPTRAEPPPADSSPWQRLRARFAMPGCDYNPAVQHWARWYTEDPSGFRTSLSQAMPFLLVVLDQIEQRKLPGEFAFLPYLESNYTPLASSGDRAAGIWQLMPDTAREAGLRISHDYDGRLDVYTSTTAALELLQRYQHEFGDWRLADMAYNAGEYRIRQLVGTGPKQRTAAELSRLRVNRGTHEHLSKLLALACIISDPERFDVELPEPQDSDHLVAVDFPAAIDLRLAARLANVDATRLQRLNPGYLRAQMPADGPWHLLIPVASKDALERTLAELPQSAWRDWHDVILQRTETISVLASANAIDSITLAAINHVDSTASLAPGTRLLLPGRSGGDHDAALAITVTARPTGLPVAVVRSGDTLWGIARREHVRLDDLLRWNGLVRNTTLRLGQRLHLRAPTEVAGGQTTAAAAAAN